MTDTSQPNENPAETTVNPSVERSRMSFGDHLDELRSCMIRALVGFALACTVTLTFGRDILQLVLKPLQEAQFANGLEPSVLVLSPSAGFLAYIKIGFLSGLILAMPWMLYQIWSFVASGLYKHEQKFVRILIPASTALFVLGVLFLYWAVLPIVLQFFIKFNQAFVPPQFTPAVAQAPVDPINPDNEPPATSDLAAQDQQFRILDKDPLTPKPGEIWINTTTRRLMVKLDDEVLSTPLELGTTASSMQSQFAIDFYISFVLLLALGFGVAFETPIVVFFLAWTGLVPLTSLTKARRFVIMGMVILAALLTPPDVVSQVMLAGPMYLLYELGILTARIVLKRSTSP